MLGQLLDVRLMVYGCISGLCNGMSFCSWDVLLQWVPHWVPIMCHGVYHSSTGLMELKQDNHLSNICKLLTSPVYRHGPWEKMQGIHCTEDSRTLWTFPNSHICILRKPGAPLPLCHLRVPPFCIATKRGRSGHGKK